MRVCVSSMRDTAAALFKRSFVAGIIHVICVTESGYSGLNRMFFESCILDVVCSLGHYLVRYPSFCFRLECTCVYVLVLCQVSVSFMKHSLRCSNRPQVSDSQ